MFKVGPVALMAVLLSGCALTQRQVRDDVSGPLAAALQLIERRGEPGRLDEAILILEGLLEDHPEDIRVLGAITRALTLRGYGYPDPDRDDYRLARELGLRCLNTNDGFASQVDTSTRRVESQALQALTDREGDCLQWTTQAWLRWLQSRGVGGAAFDLPVVQAMADRSAELGPASELVPLNEALAWGLPPPARGPDRDRVDRALDEARSLEPRRLDLGVERALLVHGPLGDTSAWRRVLGEVAGQTPSTSDPLLMENRRAVERAQALLDAGPPSPDLIPRPRVEAEGSSTKTPEPEAPEEAP